MSHLKNTWHTMSHLADKSAINLALAPFCAIFALSGFILMVDADKWYWTLWYGLLTASFAICGPYNLILAYRKETARAARIARQNVVYNLNPTICHHD